MRKKEARDKEIEIDSTLIEKGGERERDRERERERERER